MFLFVVLVLVSSALAKLRAWLWEERFRNANDLFEP